MTTHRKPAARTKPQPARIAIRINGKAVEHGPGAKWAAQQIGCVQTKGLQVGQGSVRINVDCIGAGDVAQFRHGIDDPERICQVADWIETIASYPTNAIATETLRNTAAALRNAARLREME